MTIKKVCTPQIKENPKTVVIIYWAKNNEVEEKREREREREIEREIPKGFWNGGACGRHTFRVDITCLYIG